MNIADFDVRIDIYNPTISGTGQRIVTKGSADYSNVWAKEVKSDLSDDDERAEFGQVVAMNKRSFVIRQRDMTINHDTIIVVNGDSEDYHVRAVKPYAATRDLITIHCVSRDNDA